MTYTRSQKWTRWVCEKSTARIQSRLNLIVKKVARLRNRFRSARTGGPAFEFELWVPHPTYFVGWGFSVCSRTPRFNLIEQTNRAAKKRPASTKPCFADFVAAARFFERAAFLLVRPESTIVSPLLA